MGGSLRIPVQAPRDMSWMGEINQLSTLCSATDTSSTDESAMESKECEEKDCCLMVTRSVEELCLLPTDWLPWASSTRLLGGLYLSGREDELSFFLLKFWGYYHGSCSKYSVVQA